MSGHVIDSLEMEQGHDQVLLALGQVGKVGAGKGFHPLGIHRTIGCEQSCGQGWRIRADQHGAGKVASIGAQPVCKILQHEIAHEIVVAGAPGKIAGDLDVIEQAGRGGHGKGFRQGRVGGNIALMDTVPGEVKDIERPVRLGRSLAGLGRLLLDQFYPLACIACQAPLEDSNGLCAACFAGLRQISAPLCPVLGIPFDIDQGPDALSAEALADPPPFARARAAVCYGEIAGTLVSRLKYGDRPELARFCARLMAAGGRDLWAAGPVLVPVPLHASRLRFRRYNQSMLLARELGRLTGLAVDPHLVRRHRKTRQQVGLSGDGRLRNVQGAFSVHPRLPERLQGRPVVLVDDVYTTGATVKAVTRVLKRAGAGEVNVMTFARVVIGEDSPI